MELDPPVKRMLAVAVAIVLAIQASMWLAEAPLHGRPLQRQLEWAHSLAVTGDAEGARKAFRDATGLHPDAPEAWLGYGDFLEAAGDDAGAEQAFRRASGIVPASAAAGAAPADAPAVPGAGAPGTAPVPEAWRRLGLLLWRRGAPAEAEAALATASAAGDIDASRDLALFIGLVRRGDADAMTQRVLARMGEDPPMLLWKAGARSLAGARDEADLLFGRACRSSHLPANALAESPDPWVRYLAARFLAIRGDAAAASACVSAAMTGRRPPLTRAQVLEDPAFAHAAEPLAAALAAWPLRSSDPLLPERPIAPVTAPSATPIPAPIPAPVAPGPPAVRPGPPRPPISL